MPMTGGHRGAGVPLARHCRDRVGPGEDVIRRAWRDRPAGSDRIRFGMAMARPLLAVILGTFTLRLATGLTGSMLVYYYAVLPGIRW